MKYRHGRKGVSYAALWLLGLVWLTLAGCAPRVPPHSALQLELDLRKAQHTSLALFEALAQAEISRLQMSTNPSTSTLDEWDPGMAEPPLARTYRRALSVIVLFNETLLGQLTERGAERAGGWLSVQFEAQQLAQMAGFSPAILGQVAPIIAIAGELTNLLDGQAASEVTMKTVTRQVSLITALIDAMIAGSPVIYKAMIFPHEKRRHDPRNFNKPDIETQYETHKAKIRQQLTRWVQSMTAYRKALEKTHALASRSNRAVSPGLTSGIARQLSRLVGNDSRSDFHPWRAHE